MKVSIPLATYLEMGGKVKKGEHLYCKPIFQAVNFVKKSISEHGDILIHFKVNDSHEIYTKFNHLPITVHDFNIETEICLKDHVKDLLKLAYQNGSFFHNTMAQTLAQTVHKDVKALSVEEFLENYENNNITVKLCIKMLRH